MKFGYIIPKVNWDTGNFISTMTRDNYGEEKFIGGPETGPIIYRR